MSPYQVADDEVETFQLQSCTEVEMHQMKTEDKQDVHSSLWRWTMALEVYDQSVCEKKDQLSNL